MARRTVGEPTPASSRFCRHWSIRSEVTPEACSRSVSARCAYPRRSHSWRECAEPATASRTATTTPRRTHPRSGARHQAAQAPRRGASLQPSSNATASFFLRKRESTQVKYRCMGNEHLRPRFDGRRLGGLTADDLARLVRDLRSEGKSEAPLQSCLAWSAGSTSSRSADSAGPAPSRRL